MYKLSRNRTKHHQRCYLFIYIININLSNDSQNIQRISIIICLATMNKRDQILNNKNHMYVKCKHSHKEIVILILLFLVLLQSLQEA